MLVGVYWLLQKGPVDLPRAETLQAFEEIIRQGDGAERRRILVVLLAWFGQGYNLRLLPDAGSVCELQDSFIDGADYLNKVGREVLEDDRPQPIRSRGFLPNEARKGLPHQVRSDDVRVASLDMIKIEMGMDVMWEGGRLGSGEVGVYK